MLQRLGLEKVAVPKPFRDGKSRKNDLVSFDLLADDKDFSDDTYGFFQEYLELKTRYVEMVKKGNDKKKRGEWPRDTIDTNEPNSMRNIGKTKESLHYIVAAWGRPGGYWGDFQALLSSRHGRADGD